jgi:hypothetical protein
MKWHRLQDRWKQLKGRIARRSVSLAREKQLAEWLVREHKTDPIHK